MEITPIVSINTAPLLLSLYVPQIVLFIETEAKLFLRNKLTEFF